MQVHAHAGVFPVRMLFYLCSRTLRLTCRAQALGVKGEFQRSDVKRPGPVSGLHSLLRITLLNVDISQNDCGDGIDIAGTLGTSTAVTADAQGIFTVTAQNFNGYASLVNLLLAVAHHSTHSGGDGSRNFNGLLDATAAGKFKDGGVKITIDPNGNAVRAPSLPPLFTPRLMRFSLTCRTRATLARRRSASSCPTAPSARVATRRTSASSSSSRAPASATASSSKAPPLRLLRPQPLPLLPRRLPPLRVRTTPAALLQRPPHLLLPPPPPRPRMLPPNQTRLGMGREATRRRTAKTKTTRTRTARAKTRTKTAMATEALPPRLPPLQMLPQLPLLRLPLPPPRPLPPPPLRPPPPRLLPLQQPPPRPLPPPPPRPPPPRLPPLQQPLPRPLLPLPPLPPPP